MFKSKEDRAKQRFSELEEADLDADLGDGHGYEKEGLREMQGGVGGSNVYLVGNLDSY